MARRLPVLEDTDATTDTPLCIVAGGPSLEAYLPALKAFLADSHLMTVNGAYKHLRSMGIESDHFVLLDSRPANVCHVDSPYSGTNHVIASQVHPDVFETLRDYPVTLYHTSTPATLETVGPGGSHLQAPVGMASVHAIYIAAALGYKNIFLFGYDFSHRDQERYAFDQPMNGQDEVLEIKLGGKVYRTTLSLARTADIFVRAISPVMRGHDLSIQVCGSGLLPARLQYEQENIPDEVRERQKYEAIWEIEEYRTVSPGLEFVEDAVESLRMTEGMSVADLGCGTGRATKWFSDHGFDAFGVDIARNALEEDVQVHIQPLWEPLPEADYGFSVDVLEHIPTDKVEATLKAIHKACRVGCYLNIDTIHDSFGAMIGQRLHMTVQPASWWNEQLSKLWPDVSMREDGKQAIFVCRR